MKKLTTTTLEFNDNPTWVLCPGHVSQKDFNAAFKREWRDNGGYKQKDLSYEYWTVNENSKGVYFKKSVPGKNDSKPYTVARWD